MRDSDIMPDDYDELATHLLLLFGKAEPNTLAFMEHRDELHLKLLGNRVIADQLARLWLAGDGVLCARRLLTDLFSEPDDTGLAERLAVKVETTTESVWKRIVRGLTRHP